MKVGDRWLIDPYLDSAMTYEQARAALEEPRFIAKGRIIEEETIRRVVYE